MLRPRLPRKTVFIFCLAIAALGVLLLFLNAMNTTYTRYTIGKSSSRRFGKMFSLGWKRPVQIQEATSFENSPYNADNKRPLVAKGSGSGETKVISWQASRTLRVKSTTSDMFQDCAVKACEVSPSSKSLPRAQAIVFDDGRMNKQTPPGLNDNRVLVYYDMRTSNEVYFKAKGDLFSPYWKSAINWVWSYRVPSDIFEPFSYLKNAPSTGKLKKLVDGVTSKKSRLGVWINPKVSRKEDSLEDLDKNFHKGKSQTGAEDYMKELKISMSFDTVDILSLQAEMNLAGAGDRLILSKYYFIFAFEWVSCQDYVSDLFFYAFDPRIQAIPVVRGGVSYTQHFPKDTFINADDFQSPKALAKYLDNLASNTKAYHQMLLNKNRYVREDGVNHAWCQLCDMLHRLPKEKRLRQRYEDIHAWSRENGKCVVSNNSDAEGTTDDVV